MAGRTSGRIVWVMAWLLVAIAAGVGVVFFWGVKPSPPPPPLPTTMTSSQPATTQSVAATAPAPTIQTYGQLLYADFPHYPETRPYGVPVDLADAAHIVLREPVYVCSRGDLWITHPNADPLSAVLARASGENEHIVNRRIRYIIWSPDRRGNWHAAAVCPIARGNEFLTPAGYEIVSERGSQALAEHHRYLWDQAMTWSDDDVTRLIVPCDDGVSVITLGAKLQEDYCWLAPEHATTRPTQTPAVLFDTRGLLAWIPADEHFAATRVARFVDGKWATLDAAAWPGDIVYLVPLLDGSVLQIHLGQGDSALTFISLENPDIDEKDVTNLVEQLGDDDPEKRVAAYQRLAQYGPKINPVLQKLVSNAAPEAQARIQELLRHTTLGGMSVNGSELHLVSRLHDGGMVFFTPQGVSIPQEGQDPKVVMPDYLAVRPGRAVQELPAAVIDRLVKSKGSVTGWGDEWIVSNAEVGPARFLPPDQLTPLFTPTERKFTRLVAIDGRGRWVFADDSAHRTLILDPTVPDPTPRLAIWLVDTGNLAGWNKADYPAIRRGTAKWYIDDHDFEGMDQSEPILETPAKAPPATTQESGPVLLVDSDGTRYYDGKTTLATVDVHGRLRVWALPDACAGSADEPAFLAPDHQGHFFLFNSTGRIARLRATPGEMEPFVLEAVFSDHVPDFNEVKRVWLDPAGRIDVAYELSHLAVIFPNGQVPRDIGDKILIQDLRRMSGQ